MKNILLTKKFLEKDLQYIKNKCRGINFIDPGLYNQDKILKFLDHSDIKIDCLLGPILVEHSSLNLIQIPWSGIDNITGNPADISIPVCCSKSNSNVVAEHAISLYFSLAKNISYHDKLMRFGEWARPNSEYFYPSLALYKQNVGLLGFGSISRLVRHKLKNIVNSISICNRSIVDDINYFSLNEINSFIKSVDVIFVCLPSNDLTRNIINDIDDSLFQNKIIINISRKDLISEKKLQNLIKSNILHSYSSDVWYSHNFGSSYNYPLSDKELLENKNIIFSPHRAAFIEDELPHLDDVIHNFLLLLNSKNCFKNQVN